MLSGRSVFLVEYGDFHGYDIRHTYRYKERLHIQIKLLSNHLAAKPIGNWFKKVCVIRIKDPHNC